MENKTNKCIIMSRVSTSIQELDIQEEECINLALADGYTKENMILVPRLGESARKIGQIITVDTPRGKIEIELDRDGIWDMKKRIENDTDIDAVYIWEVSRLARRMDVLTPLLKYFADKQIQLVVKTNGIRYLNPDKTVNSASKMTIEILGELAEQEMELKIKRFKRTKKAYAEMGKYSGGKIPYGYEIDREHGSVYVVKESEAAIVREIYALYEAGISQPCIAREFYRRGILDVNLTRVNNVLTNEFYTGCWHKNGWSSYERQYPPIITKEQYDKCRKIAESNNTFASKAKHIYYAHKLIECKCGRKWGAAPSQAVYRCAEAHRTGNEFEIHSKQCDYKLCVSINILDSILWHVAQEAEVNYIIHTAEADKEKYQNQINILDQKLKFIERRLQEQDKKKERIADSYIDLIIDKPTRNAKIKAIETEIANILHEQTLFVNERSHLVNLIDNVDNSLNLMSTDSMVDYMSNILQLKLNIQKITDDAERYRIIHRHIRRVTIENRIINYEFGLVGKKDTAARFISVDFYIGETKWFYYLPNSGGKNVILKTDKEGIIQQKITDIKYLGRIYDEGKRQLNKTKSIERAATRLKAFPPSEYCIGYAGLAEYLGVNKKQAYAIVDKCGLYAAKTYMNKKDVAFNKKKCINLLRELSARKTYYSKLAQDILTRKDVLNATTDK